MVFNQKYLDRNIRFLNFISYFHMLYIVRKKSSDQRLVENFYDFKMKISILIFIPFIYGLKTKK